jgi:hypothetical protein
MIFGTMPSITFILCWQIVLMFCQHRITSTNRKAKTKSKTLNSNRLYTKEQAWEYYKKEFTN